MTARAIGTSVRVQVPARIHLHLAVGDREQRGCPDVVTVMHAVDLYDELVVDRAAKLSVTTSDAPGDVTGGVPGGAPGGSGGASAAGPGPTGATAATAAAAAAVRAFADRLGVAASVAVHIARKIPAGSGLGGTSAAAAGALLGCAALWGAELRRDELAAIGAAVRPGVPFALSGGTSVGTGRGEPLSPVLARTALHWVLALPGARLAGPAIFARLAALRATGSPPRAGDMRDLLAALASGDATRVAKHLVNDLQPAAVALLPALRGTLRAGLDAGALGAVVTGVGSTVALLAADRDAASRIAAELAGSGTCRTVHLASGPVPGARVVDAA